MMTRTIILYIVFALISTFSFGQIGNKKIEPLSIGEKISFRSDILDEERILNIYLPNEYAPDSTKKYPVIYLLDGSIDEDFIHIAGIVQFGSYSWINFVPKSIVVGISNVNRQRDFVSPTTRKRYIKAIPDNGGSENFIQFIADEVQPLIQGRYKTNERRTIIGQSLGGLLATEILVRQSQLFTDYIIVSPSLWWDKESLLNIDLPDLSNVKSIFIGVGKEGKEMEHLAKRLYDKIGKTKPIQLHLFFEYFQALDHANILHLAVYSAFNKIFMQINTGK